MLHPCHAFGRARHPSIGTRERGASTLGSHHGRMSVPLGGMTG
jgi:hypothetical protein